MLQEREYCSNISVSRNWVQPEKRFEQRKQRCVFKWRNGNAGPDVRARCKEAGAHGNHRGRIVTMHTGIRWSIAGSGPRMGPYGVGAGGHHHGIPNARVAAVVQRGRHARPAIYTKLVAGVVQLLERLLSSGFGGRIKQGAVSLEPTQIGKLVQVYEGTYFLFHPVVRNYNHVHQKMQSAEPLYQTPENLIHMRHRLAGLNAFGPKA